MPSAERAGHGPRNSWHFPSAPHKGWTGRPCLGWQGVLEERGTQASESRTLSCPARQPPPSVLVPGQHSSLTTTPAQRQPSQAAPRCQGRECQGGPPSVHSQVPCGLPPRGTRVQDKHLLIEGVALCVSKVERRKDSERTQVGK